MFPCSFKIPGHSGTDFKHRKAFNKVEELQDKRKRTSGAIMDSNYDAEPNKYKRNSSFSKWFKAGLLLTTFIFSFFFIKNQASNISNQLSKYGAEGEIIKAQSKKNVYTRAYRILTSTGNDYLYWNMLDEAQSEFALALKIDKNGKAANLGMTKTLIKKCAQKSEYCQEAKAYLNYMRSLGEVLDNELLEIENLLVSE